MSDAVLVVEDHAGLRDAVRMLLESEGYEVYCAETPDEALALLSRVPHPRMLLWDALTPRHSLALVNRAIREGIHVATIPVSMASDKAAGSTDWKPAKRLTSEEAILRILREHCPLTPVGKA